MYETKLGFSKIQCRHICYSENTNTGSASPPQFHQIRLAWHQRPPFSWLLCFVAGRWRGERTPGHHPDLITRNKLGFSSSRILHVFVRCTETLLLGSRCDRYTREVPQISGMEFHACLSDTNDGLLTRTHSLQSIFGTVPHCTKPFFLTKQQA